MAIALPPNFIGSAIGGLRLKLERLPDGLYGHAVQILIEKLSSERSTNIVAWFCLMTVLKGIEEEWEDECLPKVRADEIDQKLLPIVQRFLTHTLETTYTNSEQDIKQLIEAYLSLYN